MPAQRERSQGRAWAVGHLCPGAALYAALLPKQKLRGTAVTLMALEARGLAAFDSYDDFAAAAGVCGVLADPSVFRLRHVQVRN